MEQLSSLPVPGPFGTVCCSATVGHAGSWRLELTTSSLPRTWHGHVAMLEYSRWPKWDGSPAGCVNGIACQLPNTSGGRTSIRLGDCAIAYTTGATKSSQWVKFVSFCTQEGDQPVPASVATIVAYIVYLKRAELIPTSSTITSQLSASGGSWPVQGTGCPSRECALSRRTADPGTGKVHHELSGNSGEKATRRVVLSWT